MLSEMGFVYDSSIFPIKLKKYGIANFPVKDELYQLPNGREIVELPLTVLDWGNKKIPVAGGGYMRACPQFIMQRIFQTIE